MRLISIFVAALAICELGFSQETDDLKAIQGKWYLVQIDAFGQIMTPSKEDKKNVNRRPSVIVFKEDKMYMDDEFYGAISLDTAKKPKQINSECVAGIYKLEKDTFVICWSSAPEGKTPQRPDEFKTDRERPSDRMLTLKRTLK